VCRTETTAIHSTPIITARPLTTAGLGRRQQAVLVRLSQSVDLSRNARPLDVGQRALRQTLACLPGAPELGSLRRRQMAARVVVDDDATLMPLRVLEVALHGGGRRKRAPLTAVSQPCAVK